MAQPARSVSSAQRQSALPRARDWSGELHGPVADMHRDIEAVFATDGSVLVPVAPALGPVERLLRSGSRLLGWTALALAVVGLAVLL